MLFPDNSQLRNARATSLGSTFVGWAAKANKLPELSTLLQSESYNKNPASTVPSLVLQTLMELQQNRDTDAAAHLNELSEFLQKAPNASMMQLACHAALPATERKGLEEVSYGILKQAIMTPWNPPSPNRISRSPLTFAIKRTN